MKYAFIHANLIKCDETMKVLSDYTVLVEDERIIDIGKTEEIDIKEYKVIDLENKFLLPGLVNLHVHLFGTGKPSKVLGGGSLQKKLISFIKTKLGNKVADLLVKNNAKNALMSGVTTIRSVGDFCYSDVRIRDKINKNKIVGPRLIVSGPAITCVGGHGDNTFSISSNDPKELINLTELNIKKRVDHIKICVTGGVMDAKKRGEPGEVKMTFEQIKAICDFAHLKGYKVASHTESIEGIRLALKGGVDTIEHGSTMDDEIIELFKKNNSSFIVTSSPALPLAKLDPSITKLDEMARFNTQVVLENMIDGAKNALKEKIMVGLGTDASCPLVSQTNMWREVYYFSKYYNVTPSFALYTATFINSKILGLENEIGSIEIGKIADMIVLDKNPLEDLTNLKKIDKVIIGGKLILHPKTKVNKQLEKYLDSIE